MVAVAAVLFAAMLPAQAFDRSKFCYIIPRFRISTSGSRPSDAQMVWAFAQVTQTYKELYRYVEGKRFVLDGVRLEYWSDVIRPGSRGGRHLKSSASGGIGKRRDKGSKGNKGKGKGKSKGERRHRPYNATEFDLKSLDMDMLHDFKRFDGGGLDIDTINELEAEEGGETRNLRGGESDRRTDTDSAGSGRVLAEYKFGDGYDFSGRFSGKVGCYECDSWKYEVSTTTHGGNTPEYLHWRWEAGWCERLTQKARRNSGYSVFRGARDCDIYVVGCRDAAYRRLEGEDEHVENAGVGVAVPASIVESYRAALAKDLEKAAVADALEAQHEAMAAADLKN